MIEKLLTASVISLRQSNLSDAQPIPFLLCVNCVKGREDRGYVYLVSFLWRNTSSLNEVTECFCLF